VKLFKRKPKLMRDKPAPKNQYLNRWYSHVEHVGQELANAAAPPPWWGHIWHSLGEYFGFNAWRELGKLLLYLLDLEWLDRPSNIVQLPTKVEQMHPRCTHDQARMTTVGAMIRKPKVGDRAVLGIEAMTCPACGMTVAVLR